MGNQHKTAIFPTRAENFPEWYQEVVRASDMAENAPVRGCMTIKPYGFAVWEGVQNILGQMIKDQGVQNAYFPMLIPLSYLSKEAEHIDGFAKECAVVTHHRLGKGADGKLVPEGELTEPYVVRPTSETIIGEAMSRWVQSYRDLPMKLNQWCNVMRWEMRPRVFLRTAEFLWQEGHNCFASADDAQQDALKMLDVYEDFFLNILALHVIKGEKTPDERFPGAVSTYTIEAMMQDGKAVQSGTSHNLGQTFSRGSNIQFQNEKGEQQFAYTTSWGVSTRMVGAMIMAHGDDDGMVMPPRIAPYQVTVIPVYKDENSIANIRSYCEKLEKEFLASGIRVHMDLSDDRASNKMWSSIKKGIPIRVEVGASEVSDQTVTMTRRDIGRDSKKSVPVSEIVKTVKVTLGDIHSAMLDRSRQFTESHILDMSNVKDIHNFFATEQVGFVRMDTSLLEADDIAKIRKEFAVSPRCMPFEFDGKKVLIGRSY